MPLIDRREAIAIADAEAVERDKYTAESLAALDEAGIPYDRKKFVPHITIIRRMTGKWKQVPAPKGEMMVKSISLMKSVEKDGRRVYIEQALF